MFLEFKLRSLYILLNYLIVFYICYIYKQQLLYCLIKPSFILLIPSFIFTNLHEIFLVYYKLSLYISIIWLIPIILIHIFLFIVPGLRKYELYFLIIFSVLILILSSLFFLINQTYILPYLCNFLLKFEQSKDIELISIFFEGKLLDYFYFLINFYINIFYINIFFNIFFCLNLILNLNIYILFLNFRKYLYGFFILINAIFVAYDFLSFFCSTLFFLLWLELIIFFLFLIKTLLLIKPMRIKNFKTYKLMKQLLIFSNGASYYTYDLNFKRFKFADKDWKNASFWKEKQKSINENI